MIGAEVQSLLESRHPLPRAVAWRTLLGQWWHEDPSQPGKGQASDQARAAVPWLLERLALEPAEAHRAAAALILICEAEVDAGGSTAGVHALVRDAAPRLVALLAKLPAETPGASPVRKALAYLIARTSENPRHAADALTPVLGADSRLCQVALTIAESGSTPRLARFVASYLSADIISTAFDDSVDHVLRTLACPACHSRLEVTGTALACNRCSHRYPFQGSVLDLLPADFHGDIEFTEEIVQNYEREARPRFVRVMAADWDGLITAEVEQHYLNQQLQAPEGMVVDLGCGAGSRTDMVAKQVGARRVLAVDISLPMLETCSAAVPGIVPVRADAMALPLASASVAAINCSDALQAFPDVGRVLNEVARVLRPGGVLTGFTFVESVSEPVRYVQHRFPAWPRRLLTSGTLTQTIARAGLTVCHLRQLGQGVFFTASRSELQKGAVS
ncbi:MAG: hypothetical protein RLZZ53_1218 [Acidobacteriota bacterium]